MYDKDDKVNPPEPLRRGNKSGGKVAKWITGVQTKTNGKKVLTKGQISFHEIRFRHEIMIKQILKNAIVSGIFWVQTSLKTKKKLSM